MKIPFDIKYRPQIESGEYAVFTDCGEPVEIVKWDCKGNCPILAVIDDGDTHDCCFFKSDGLSFSEKESLYIVTPESEYTEFEKKVAEILFYRQDEDDWVMCLKLGKEYAKELLNIAKREFHELTRKRLCSVCKEHRDGYQEGFENATRDLPRWQIFKGFGIAIADDYVLVKLDDGYKLLRKNDLIAGGIEFLQVSQLEKLPKEESK